MGYQAFGIFNAPCKVVLKIRQNLDLVLSSEFILGDKLVGEVSRLVVAEACIQAMDIDSTRDQIYEINSITVNIFKILCEFFGLAL